MLDQSEAMNFEKKDQYFNCLQNFKMPIAYKTTKNICQLFELMVNGANNQMITISDLFNQKQNQSGFSYSLSNIFKISKNGNIFPFLYQNVFYENFVNSKQKFQSEQLDLLIEQVKNDRIQSIFLFLIKKKIDLQMIESLPFSLKAPIYEILRNLRLHLPEEL